VTDTRVSVYLVVRGGPGEGIYGKPLEFLRLEGVFKYARWDRSPSSATVFSISQGTQWAVALDARVVSPGEVMNVVGDAPPQIMVAGPPSSSARPGYGGFDPGY
jgi:hypothetical protein